MTRCVPKPGFKSEEQRQKFLAAGREHGFGGPLAKTCGARLSGGRRCPQPPLQGETRCLRHGGPHAAVATVNVSFVVLRRVAFRLQSSPAPKSKGLGMPLPCAGARTRVCPGAPLISAPTNGTFAKRPAEGAWMWMPFIPPSRIGCVGSGSVTRRTEMTRHNGCESAEKHCPGKSRPRRRLRSGRIWEATTGGPGRGVS